MSATTSDGRTSSRLARLTGAFYLAYIAATVLADVIGHIGMGTPADVADVMTADPWRFQLALVLALASGVLFLVTAWGLYVLLRPVNRDVALLFLLLNAVGVAIQGSSLLSLVYATLPGDASAHLQAWSAEQVQALAYLAITTYKASFVTAQLFFGTWLFPLGYLVYRSGFMPRLLGALLLVDGVAVLVWFVQALLFPDYHAITYPGLAVSFVAELGLSAWLLIRGVAVKPAAAAAAGVAA